MAAFLFMEGFEMTTAEQILQMVQRLPQPMALEVLDFTEYLTSKYERQADRQYLEAKQRAMALMESGFDLGGQGIRDRDALHER